ACFPKGDARMVNQEQDVMDRVHNGHVRTDALRDVFTLEPFDESMLNDTEAVFDIDAVGHHAHATAAGSLVTPIDEGEPFDLFKLQDEEPMDALDPTKEPPADWEPGPEDVGEGDILADTKWDDL